MTSVRQDDQIAETSYQENFIQSGEHDTQTGADLMNSVSIPVILDKLPRNGLPMAVGFIRAGDLIPRARIAYREFEGSRGYQRLPSTTRVNLLARELLGRKVDLPTGLLLNLRTYDESVHITRTSDGATFLNLADDYLWEVDGQHRCEGLKRALETDYERFRDYVIPFVTGLGWSEEVEMEQFYVVNSTAKNVPTTIAYDLLAQRSQGVPGLMEDLEERGRAWQAHGQELAKEMATAGSIWKDRIRFSNEPKGITTVPSAGFVNSLKPIFNSAYFNRLTRGAQAKVLAAYWEAQRSILPTVFSDPQEHVLQKSLGVQVMHSIFNEVIEVVRANEDPVTDPASYVKVLGNALTNLSGDNREGLPVSGEDFWISGQAGAAGAFSSSAGRRVLTARLKIGLPKIGSSEA